VVLTTAWRYTMHGLRVESDRRLPFLPEAAPAGGVPSCRYRWAAAEQCPWPPAGSLVTSTACTGACHSGSVVFQVVRGPEGAWFWHRDVATLHVHPDAREITVYPAANAEEDAVALALIGKASTFVLHQQGTISLHASAVSTSREAVVFLGPPGQGKSTMAASFVSNGASLISDDVLPLHATPEGVFAVPSLPIMKLWPHSARGVLALDHELPNLTSWHPKKLVGPDQGLRFAETPLFIRAIYVLDRFDPTTTGRAPEPRIRPLGGHQRMAALVAQLSVGACLLPSEVAASLPLFARLLAQAPCTVLSYPSGFQYQDLVHACVLEHAERHR
jgi:hypothetical protein